jgi:dihydropteroate synthase
VSEGSLLLRLAGHELSLEAGPAAPDGRGQRLTRVVLRRRPPRRLDAQVEHAPTLAREGADLIDVGGESGVTDRPPIGPDEEKGRVLPLVERLVEEGLLVSVDSWSAEVASAAVAAGAVLVNDVSGLLDPEVASVCARSGAGLVLTHTRAAPKGEGIPAV